MQVDMIQVLLENSASKNETNQDGLTALQMALKNGNDEVVMALQSHGKADLIDGALSNHRKIKLISIL